MGQTLHYRLFLSARAPLSQAAAGASPRHRRASSQPLIRTLEEEGRPAVILCTTQDCPD